MSEFAGKVAVVTGASSGIGRRTAEMLVDRGARVAIFARSAEKLAAIAEPFGEQMLAIAGDVSDLGDIERLFAATESKLGRCNILINNAGTIEPAALADITLDQWQRTFDVNVRAIFLTCRRAIPSMVERHGGAIVNVASISGILGTEKFPGYVAYCASKGAVISLTEALAVEMKERGVRVNAVSPGSVDTAMWAAVSGGAPASMTPDQVAETILFLASERSKPINGQNVHVFSA